MLRYLTRKLHRQIGESDLDHVYMVFIIDTVEKTVVNPNAEGYNGVASKLPAARLHNYTIRDE